MSECFSHRGILARAIFGDWSRKCRRCRSRLWSPESEKHRRGSRGPPTRRGNPSTRSSKHRSSVEAAGPPELCCSPCPSRWCSPADCWGRSSGRRAPGSRALGSGTEGASPWSRGCRYCRYYRYYRYIYVDIYLEQEPVHLRKRTEPKSIVTVVRWPAW